MTSSTDDKRVARSGPRGTSKGTRASARVRLARTMRWATVGSGTRNARAISSVVRPPSKRRVSATRGPNDGHELQAQAMTVRPSLRLAPQDAEDIASYLITLKEQEPAGRGGGWALRSCSEPEVRGRRWGSGCGPGQTQRAGLSSCSLRGRCPSFQGGSKDACVRARCEPNEQGNRSCLFHRRE